MSALGITEEVEVPPSKRRRWPLRATIAVVVLALSLVGLDLTARALSENHLAIQVRSATGARTTSVRIIGFPFIPPLLASGSIAKLHVTATTIPAGTVVLDRVSIDADDVRVDRQSLISDRQVRVTAIASARVTVEVNAAEISAAVGYRITLADDHTLTAEVNGIAVPADVRIEDGATITVTTSGTPLGSFDLSSSELVPKCAMIGDTTAQRITFSCVMAPVPASLLESLSGAPTATWFLRSLGVHRGPAAVRPTHERSSVRDGGPLRPQYLDSGPHHRPLHRSCPRR
jgi:LmeA-like phospholipid-binding